MAAPLGAGTAPLLCANLARRSGRLFFAWSSAVSAVPGQRCAGEFQGGGRPAPVENFAALAADMFRTLDAEAPGDFVV